MSAKNAKAGGARRNLTGLSQRRSARRKFWNLGVCVPGWSLKRRSNMKTLLSKLNRSIIALSLIVFTLLSFVPTTVKVASAYTPPANNRLKYNFNYDWKFIKQDVVGAEAVAFNDSAWLDVSLPHTYNDIDHYDTWVTGDRKS